jgi:hypothetical protein
MAVLVHLTLFFAVLYRQSARVLEKLKTADLTYAERVVVLHGHELGPAILLGDILHVRKLERPHGACANITDLARLHEVVQCLHGLGDRDRGIEAVDLQQVDVRRLQSAQARIDSVEDGSSAQAALVDVVLARTNLRKADVVRGRLFAHDAEAFGQYRNLVSRDLECLERLADEFLADAGRVDVRCIPGVQTTVVCGFEEPESSN